MKPPKNEVFAKTKKFKKLSRKTHAQVSKSKIHDLRVLCRRLEVAASFFNNSTKAKKELSKFVKSLGKARAIDVAIADAKSLNLSIKDLKKIRKRKRSKLKSTLKNKNRRKIYVRLKKTFKQEPDLQGLIEDLFENLQSFSAFPPHDNNSYHALRILLKKVRYCLEYFDLKTEKIEELQQILGRAHDFESLQKYFDDARIKRKQAAFLKKVRGRILPTLMAAMTELGKLAA